MSTGLKVLLDAAQYIEHQEKLKRSPTAASNGSVEESYISQCSTGFDIANGVRNNNNTIMNARNIRPTTALVQVSSSAPAASTTFHHITNGVIITNNNSSLTGSQLLVEMKPSQRKLNNNRTMSEYDRTIEALQNSPKILNSSNLLSIQTNTSTDNAVNESSISEDAFSSNLKSSPTLNGLAALLSIRPTVRCSNKQQEHQQLPATEEELTNGKNGHNKKSKAYIASKAYRHVDSDSCDIVVVTAAANKQMLLNDGLRVASPAADTYSIPSKAISIPQQAQQPLYNSVASKFSLINSTSAPQSILYKSSEPLTPPPIACRKVDETHSRIRSFSLSHKIPASQPLLKNGELGKMMIEDGTALQCIEDDESLTQHNSTGSHYLQMMSAQHSATSIPLMHMTPMISASGRRRTISSNSNGAGTREVHNKLEKNRRAHLKECYEQLKNQLPLKEDERKKTSNLAILGEAIKYVKTLKKKDQELEAEVEQLAKIKINSQLKLVSLKRELGPKYEQMFPGPFLDFDLNNCEKDNSNETGSLSSGRGSILYSSSSSLSSGGSNGSTTMSSPVGASMPQASALSPVISKACINTNISSIVKGNKSASNISVATKSPAVFEHKQQQIKSSASISDYTSPAGMSPTNTGVALANRSITNVSNVALSLTAKNISAMSLTRDSPTPSTPSPSPSSSSCVSSSSSLISSSPPRPLNGIISGRSVTVSIPNNVKYANSGVGTSRVIGPVTGSTIVNPTSSTTATILSASSPSNAANSTNNAIMLQALRGCHLV